MAGGQVELMRMTYKFNRHRFSVCFIYYLNLIPIGIFNSYSAICFTILVIENRGGTLGYRINSGLQAVRCFFHDNTGTTHEQWRFVEGNGKVFQELSARSKNETLFDAGQASDFYHETRYGAGLAWSPSEYYSMALKVNRLRESRTDNEQISGSGVLSWFPSRELEFTVSYGDHLVGGDRAFMLGTKIDLNGS